jgi:hypothetical protein
MDVGAVPKDFEIIPLLLRPMPKPGVPNQRDDNGSTVHKIDAQRFIIDAQ